MQIRTIAVTVSAERDLVFGFLADIENLPKWAGDFCERIELRRNGWLAYTAQGDVMVAAEADDRTGVIDLRIETSVAQSDLLLLRVVPLGEQRVMASLTIIQPTGQVDELYEQRYGIWRDAMQGLTRRFGGGELHAPGDALQLGVLGLN